MILNVGTIFKLFKYHKLELRVRNFNLAIENRYYIFIYIHFLLVGIPKLCNILLFINLIIQQKNGI